jgi:hypothetical protein
MGDYKIAVNKIHRNFNKEQLWSHHIVQILGNLTLPFCGASCDLMTVDNADGYLKDIKSGKEMIDSEGNPFCKKCIATVLAPGSDREKDRKRVKKYNARRDRKIENEAKHKRLIDLKSRIIREFLSICLECKESVIVKPRGFSLRAICEKCVTEWIYTLCCELNGTFEVFVDKNKDGNRHQTAIGNILWEKPFIEFSELRFSES